MYRSSPFFKRYRKKVVIKMQYMNFILGIIALIILVIGLVYTIWTGKLVDARQSEYDTKINEKVEERPYLRNPIFLAYMIFIGILLFYLIYVGLSTEW
jgi:glucose uptake protein GlcU